MSQTIRSVLTAVTATVSLACLAAPAFPDTPWPAITPAGRGRQPSRHRKARTHQKVNRADQPCEGRAPACRRSSHPHAGAAHGLAA